MQICKSVAGSVMNSGSREQHVAVARAFCRGRRRSTGTLRAEGRQPRAYFCFFLHVPNETMRCCCCQIALFAYIFPLCTSIPFASCTARVLLLDWKYFNHSSQAAALTSLCAMLMPIMHFTSLT
jgi:hypothetical protein